MVSRQLVICTSCYFWNRYDNSRWDVISRESSLVDDLISYMAVGASPAEDQQHRFVASEQIFQQIKTNIRKSQCDVQRYLCSSNKQSSFLGKVVETRNPLSHAILRGALNE